eukprot:6492322-Amphidinium_carterae.2
MFKTIHLSRRPCQPVMFKTRETSMQPVQCNDAITLRLHAMSLLPNALACPTTQAITTAVDHR